MKATLPLAVAASLAALAAGRAQLIALNNGDFESPVVSGYSTTTPDDWGYYASGPNGGTAPKASGLTNAIAESGSQSLYYTTNAGQQGAGYEAHYLLGADSLADTSPLSLNTSSQVQLTFYIRSDALDPYSGDSVARFSLEFHDNTQVGNPNVGGTGDLLELRFAADGFSTSEWVQVTLSGSPDAFSNNILFVADYQNFPSGSYTSSSGTFYVDNISASVVPEPGTLGLAFLGLSIGGFVGARRLRLNLRGEEA